MGNSSSTNQLSAEAIQEDQLVWVNPEQLFIEENVDFDDRMQDTRQRVVRLISIDMIRQYAKLLDEHIESDKLAALPFLERTPLGVYAFSLLPISADKDEKVCEVLVYSSNKEAYDRLFEGLPDLFRSEQIEDLTSADGLDDATLARLAHRVEDAYFIGLDRLPGYRREDLCDVLQYYFMYEQLPDFIAFEERGKFDIDQLAAIIYDRGIGGKRKVEFLDRSWEDAKSGWQVFFGIENKKYFVNEVSIALRRLEFPGLFSSEQSAPPDIKHPKEELAYFSLPELRTTHPQHYRQLRDEVFNKAKTSEGFYQCALTGWRSRNSFDFEIDHKKPRAKGGLTELRNLQLVRRRENRKKGTKE